MKKMAIIYYSRSGSTEKMAHYIAEGARAEDDIEVDVINIEGLSPKKALDYDGIVIGSPTYYGTMAGEVKTFLDATVAFHGKLDGKVGAAFSSAANIGGGTETTITDILHAMLVHGMVVQGNPEGGHYGPASIGSPDVRVKKQCNSLGKRVAVLIKKMA